jgi:AcrR family transcriptional regulator
VTRRYDSTLRQRQAAETRDRIVEAGCAVLRGASVRDWQGLTLRAVAEEAGVSERTVYRHFTNERGLRDAVMRRIEDESGIDLDGIALDDLPKVATRILQHVSTYPIAERPPLDPTLGDAAKRQQAALLAAAGARRDVAAVLDVLWSVASYERLVADWGMEPARAIGALTGAMQAIVDTVGSERSLTK